MGRGRDQVGKVYDVQAKTGNETKGSNGGREREPRGRGVPLRKLLGLPYSCILSGVP